ncbi:MAG TPA: IPT/TIG domain-containing protein [Thermoanaerobaculia bacterium]|nr:IPT/TIG domain-containing protein [Thermoanaerobaculia bacterium]
MRIALILLFALGGSAAEVEIRGYGPLLGSVGGGDRVELFVRLNYVDRCDPAPCYTQPVVLFGDVPARVVSADDTRIVVITPPHPPGEVTVRVHVAQYTATATGKFRFIDLTTGPYEANYERVLVPVAVSGAPLPGAYGSVWFSELWATNAGTHRVELFGDFPRCTADCAGKPFPAIEPGQSLKLAVPADGVNAGYLFWLQKGHAEDVTFSLRVRDTSRFDDNHGTEIPLARVHEFEENATLVNVPIDSRARTTLRVYADGGILPVVTVRVEVTSLTGPEILATRLLELHDHPDQRFHAHVGTLGELRTEFPNLPEGSYRITVRAVAPELSRPVFPLASVTNNRTQLVTAITPQ